MDLKGLHKKIHTARGHKLTLGDKSFNLLKASIYLPMISEIITNHSPLSLRHLKICIILLFLKESFPPICLKHKLSHISSLYLPSKPPPGPSTLSLAVYNCFLQGGRSTGEKKMENEETLPDLRLMHILHTRHLDIRKTSQTQPLCSKHP